MREWKKDKIFSEERKASGLEIDKSNLEQELKDREAALTNQITNLKQELQLYKPTMTQQWAKWIGDKTGFNGLMGFFNNLIWMAGIITLLVVYSYLHKLVFKPALKNFKKDKNDDDDNNDEEPQTRRTKRVQPEPIEAEVEVTNIETEKVKQLPEEVMDVKASPVESLETKKPVEVKEILPEQSEEEIKPKRKSKKKKTNSS